LRQDVGSPLTIIDLPRVTVETPEIVLPLADARPDDALTNDEEGGSSSDRPSASLPVPSREPDLPLAPSLSIAPVESPALAGTGTTGTETNFAGGPGVSTGVVDGGGSGGSGTGIGKGNGTGAGSGGGTGMLQMADWIVRPTDAEMLKANPFAAQVAGVSGTVLLSCQVSKDNRAKNCKTIKEVPGSYGFARAARDVVRRGLIRPPIAGARNPEDRVFVSVTFENRSSGSR
jgi:hypothetical protein